MILNKAECIICRDYDEMCEVADVLDEYGFRMIENFGRVTNCLDDSYNGFGFRWSIGREFPKCIAKLTVEHIEDVQAYGTLFDSYGRNKHTWVSGEEFLLRNGFRKEIDDLL